MKKHISKLLLSLIVLFSVFLIFLPHFTSSFLDIRQAKENEERHQKLLEEKLAQRAIEEQKRVELEQKNYLMGKFDPAERADFVLIPTEYTLGPQKMYLRREAFDAYLHMQSVASAEAVELKIVSATRNFDYQKEIWEKKWSNFPIADEIERLEKILEYSAAPGTSRHHWGTEIDINTATSSYFDTEKGKKEYEWMTKNAPLFGFCQTYNLKGTSRITGYSEEKWHWSYLPLARNFTEQYKNLIKDEDIQGFLGSEYVPHLNLIQNYVLAINPDCI
ncbi:MAG: M15 family metallopeptidase [Candidatus Paceibacterota bacterium]